MRRTEAYRLWQLLIFCRCNRNIPDVLKAVTRIGDVKEQAIPEGSLHSVARDGEPFRAFSNSKQPTVACVL